MFSKLLSWFDYIKTEKANLRGKSEIFNYYEEDLQSNYLSAVSSSLSAHSDSEKLRGLERALSGFPDFVQSCFKTTGDLPPVVPCRDMLPELYMRYGRWSDAEKVIRLCISCGAYGHTEYSDNQDHEGCWIPESGDEELLSLNLRKEAASSALSYLAENPGTLQSKIYKVPVLSSVDHDALVWFCRSSHQIRKEKDGKTNRLYIAERSI